MSQKGTVFSINESCHTQAVLGPCLRLSSVMTKSFGLITREMGAAPGIPCGLSDRTDNRHVFDAVDARSNLQFDDSTVIRQVMQAGTSSSELAGVTDKVERRRKRERESARRCRAKKQSRIRQLEDQKSALERYNRILQEQLRNFKASDPVQMRNDLVEKIQIALTESEGNAALQPLLQQYYCISEAIATSHVRIPKTLVGCSERIYSAAFTFWLLFGPETNNVKANLELIRNAFVDEIRPASEQTHAITQLAARYQDKISDVIDARRIFQELLTRMEQYLDVMRQLDSTAKTFLDSFLNNILTEMQQAKLTVWLHSKQDLLERLVDAIASSQKGE